MNILFIVPKLSGGGAEKIACMVASALSQRHRVYMIALQKDRGSAYLLDKRVRFERTPEWVFTRHVDDHIASIPENYKQYLTERKKRWHIRCAISFLEMGNQYNTASRRGERVIVSVRNNYSMKCPEKGGDAWQRNQMGLAGADTVVALSEGVKQDLSAHWDVPEERIRVIYNPCDGEALRAQAKATPLPEAIARFVGDAPYLVNVGRLVPQKGQTHLIDAFSGVRASHPEARLVILGIGPLQEELQAQIDRAGLSDRVLLAGHFENPFPVIAGARAAVCSSLYEGLGNALLEEMACGVPIVSVDSPYGPRELLTGAGDYAARPLARREETPCGILCPPIQREGAKDELTQAMIDVLSDPERSAAWGRGAQRRSEDFGMGHILGQWEALLPKPWWRWWR